MALSLTNLSGFAATSDNPNPILASSSTATANFADALTITKPSGTANGDYLIAVICQASSGNMTAATGFTLISVTSVSAGCQLRTFQRLCDGTEGASFSWDLNFSNLDAVGWIGRFSPCGSATPTDGTANTGTSTTPNPPSHSPSWGAANNTAFIACCSFASTNGTISAYPSGLPEENVTIGAASVSITMGIAIGRRQVASFDPGTFTIGASVDWNAQTIGVRAA